MNWWNLQALLKELADLSADASQARRSHGGGSKRIEVLALRSWSFGVPKWWLLLVCFYTLGKPTRCSWLGWEYYAFQRHVQERKNNTNSSARWQCCWNNAETKEEAKDTIWLCDDDDDEDDDDADASDANADDEEEYVIWRSWPQSSAWDGFTLPWMKRGACKIGRSSSSVTIWGITKRLRLAAAVMGKRHWCEHQCLWLFRGLLWRFVRSLLFRWCNRTNADTHHWASWENRKSCRSLVHRRPKSNDYVHRYVRYLHCLARSMKRSLPSGKAMSPTRTLQLLPCHLHRLACEATSDWDRHVS